MNRIHNTDNTCPECGAKLKCCSAVTEEGDRSPHPGDITLCVECGLPSIFTEELSLRHQTDEEWQAMPDEVRGKLMRARELVQHSKANQKTDRYVAEVRRIAKAIAEWRGLFPEKQPLFQFNQTQRVGIIAPLQAAMEHHFISVNEDGMELLRHCCDIENNTVFQLKAALDLSQPERSES